MKTIFAAIAIVLAIDATAAQAAMGKNTQLWNANAWNAQVWNATQLNSAIAGSVNLIGIELPR
jgi:hypothetical protein